MHHPGRDEHLYTTIFWSGHKVRSNAPPREVVYKEVWSFILRPIKDRQCMDFPILNAEHRKGPQAILPMLVLRGRHLCEGRGSPHLAHEVGQRPEVVGGGHDRKAPRPAGNGRTGDFERNGFGERSFYRSGAPNHVINEWRQRKATHVASKQATEVANTGSDASRYASDTSRYTSDTCRYTSDASR